MPELTVVIPTRGRPHTVPDLCDAFRSTCTADTSLVFAVDLGDPAMPEYAHAMASVKNWPDRRQPPCIVNTPTDSMVAAANYAASSIVGTPSDLVVVGILHDDHDPLSKGWDTAVLTALGQRPGIAFVNDHVAYAELPSHAFLSVEAARGLGHLAPKRLQHHFLGDYWRTIGDGAGCLSYLSHVVIRHRHPLFVPGIPWDETHQRAYAPDVYDSDLAMYDQYMAKHGERDISAVSRAVRDSAHVNRARVT